MNKKLNEQDLIINLDDLVALLQDYVEENEDDIDLDINLDDIELDDIYYIDDAEFDSSEEITDEEYKDSEKAEKDPLDNLEKDETGSEEIDIESEEIKDNIEECDMKEVNSIPSGKSIIDYYELRKGKQRNKIVEALFVDSTIENIETSLKAVLNAAGISKAESIVVIGLILDRMLNANDTEIAAPEFLETTISALIDNKDIIDVVKKAVERALEDDALPAPGLVDVENQATVISSEDNQEAKTINAEGKEEKAEVTDKQEEE